VLYSVDGVKNLCGPYIVDTTSAREAVRREGAVVCNTCFLCGGREGGRRRDEGRREGRRRRDSAKRITSAIDSTSSTTSGSTMEARLVLILFVIDLKKLLSIVGMPLLFVETRRELVVANRCQIAHCRAHRRADMHALHLELHF
jgi:hypothetical protein